MQKCFGLKCIAVMCVLICLFNTSQSVAQEQLPVLDYEKEIKTPYNEVYLTSFENDYKLRYDKVFALKVFTNYEATRIHIRSFDEGLKASYSPNRKTKLSLGFYYSWLNASLSVNSPIGFDSKKGKSNFFKFSSRFFVGHHFSGSITLSENKGYYADTYSGFDLGIVNPPFSRTRRELSTEVFSAEVSYIPNGKRYGFKSLFNPLEVQKKSAGSPIFRYVYNKSELSAEQPLLPLLGTPVGQSHVLRTMGLSAGYAYNLVLHNKVFTSAKVDFGVNYVQRVEGEDETNQLGFNNAVLFAVGYSADRSIIRFVTNFENTIFRSQDEDVGVAFSDFYINLEYVYKFNVRHSKVFDKVDKLIEFQFLKE